MGGIIDKLASLAKALRNDGWQNRQTGLGTTRDKAAYMGFYTGARLSHAELEIMYEESDLVATIVDSIVDDALRQGVTVDLQSDDEDTSEDKETETAITMKLDSLSAIEKMSEGAIWGRLYGGGVVWPIVTDSGRLEDPLNLDAISSVNSLLVLTAQDVYPAAWETNPNSPGFGLPSVYQVMQIGNGGASIPIVRVHASRLIVFGGQRTSTRRQLANNGWSTSVVQRPFNVMQQFETAWQSTGHLMTDSAQGVYKIAGLIDLLGSKEKENLENRMRVIEMGKSVVQGIVLDAEAEDYERKPTALTGYADVLDRFGKRLAAAARMPLTRMMGESPGGMNATGESDRGFWDESVQVYQGYLKVRFEQLVTIVMAAKDGPTGGEVLDDWSVLFPPLRQMTEMQTADLRKKVAETDQIYEQMGLPAEQILLNRFGGPKYSMETKINVDLLKDSTANPPADDDSSSDPVDKKDPPADDAPPP